tara:strand:+ start:156 stop:1307 length:1152 start_codon:yes stop_codon:yes gene_type:complete
MKNIIILGSTGSIGTQALEIVDNLKEEFNLIGISANTNVNLLAQQAKKYNPKYVCISNENYKNDLIEILGANSYKILSGRSGLLDLSKNNESDIMLNALVGSEGMEPTINAIKSGINVALSNKESLVMAGEIINEELNKNNVSLYPVDSEHSAIWQCLRGEDLSQINKIILTGSGGPFRTKNINEFENITKEEALRHPNWSMGDKITIDSSTMMNKGLEVIEARWLFNIPEDRISIVIHPESIIHSMIEFTDGSIKAQLGIPSMKIPIQYALTYPEHRPLNNMTLDLVKIKTLNFEEPDLIKFRCIDLAYQSINKGGSWPVILNVSNDILVRKFLNNKINYLDIPNIIEEILNKHEFIKHITLDDINYLMDWTKKYMDQKFND